MNEALQKLVDSGKKNLITIQNCIALNSPIELKDIQRDTDIPYSTLHSALQELVGLGTVVRTERAKDTSAGKRDVVYFSTPFRIKITALEREEVLSFLKVEAFDLSLLLLIGTVIFFMRLKLFSEAMGIIYSIVALVPYWVWFKIFKRGKWREVK